MPSHALWSQLDPLSTFKITRQQFQFIYKQHERGLLSFLERRKKENLKGPFLTCLLSDLPNLFSSLRPLVTQSSFPHTPTSPYSWPSPLGQLSTNHPLRRYLIITQCLYWFSQACLQLSVSYEEPSNRISCCKHGPAPLGMYPPHQPPKIAGYFDYSETPPCWQDTHLRQQSFSLGWAWEWDLEKVRLDLVSLGNISQNGEVAPLRELADTLSFGRVTHLQENPLLSWSPAIFSISPFFMANIKWLALPHTIPSASLKIVQPCSGFHQW